MIYLHKESGSLYRRKGNRIQFWSRAYQEWSLLTHNPTNFARMVHSGVIVRVGKWPQRVYGIRPGSKITVPDCASLRYLLAQVPTETIVKFK
ncbi:hypothetical protein vBAspALolek_08 [Aeromonas phage vB_AspA_Lolek]|nr:hypothetical protein vBAspALolek_08 [Aeromonas phage vB_AspA_Lolek]